jgi:hypothetical protein
VAIRVKAATRAAVEAVTLHSKVAIRAKAATRAVSRGSTCAMRYPEQHHISGGRVRRS